VNGASDFREMSGKLPLRGRGIWLIDDVIREDTDMKLRDWLQFPNQPLSLGETHEGVYIKCSFFCRISTKIRMVSETLQYLI
jgi:hypothetical protein